jgi:hypothetical protein
VELFILRCAIDLKPSHNKTKKRQAGDLAGKTVTKPLKDGIHLLRAAGRPPFSFYFFPRFFLLTKTGNGNEDEKGKWCARLTTGIGSVSL